MVLATDPEADNLAQYLQPTQGMITALLGGVLIGLAASVLLLGIGRISGISGIVGDIISPGPFERDWKVFFSIGLLVGGWVLLWASPSSVAAPNSPPTTLIIGGLLVGAGSRLANGCTSGHGVCGLSRGSRRSVVATATFMGVGFVVATFVRGLS